MLSFIKKNLANLITAIRIVLSFVLISLVPSTKEFLVVYTICGSTDVLDGFVARTLNITSKFGSVLDSISDLIFYAVMIIKLWRPLHNALPLYIWIIFWIIIGLRIFLYIYVGYHSKEMLSNHTILNKLTAIMIFLLPYMLMTKYIHIYAIVAVLVGASAVTYEFKLVSEKYENK